MIIWLAMLIPGIMIGSLLIVPKFRHRIVWWEVIIPAVVTVATVFICQAIAINGATDAREYWGHMGMKVVHEEPFTYDGECSTTYPCGTT